MSLKFLINVIVIHDTSEDVFHCGSKTSGSPSEITRISPDKLEAFGSVKQLFTNGLCQSK